MFQSVAYQHRSNGKQAEKSERIHCCIKSAEKPRLCTFDVARAVPNRSRQKY